MEITINSKRTMKEYKAELYTKDGTLIIRHTSLENIFWSLPDEERPEFHVEMLDLTKTPGIPPMFALTCVLKDRKTGCVFEQIGEMLCSEWQSAPDITRRYPLTVCKNIAFDRAFIRYMQFDIHAYDVAVLYSSSEISLDGSIQVTEKGVIKLPDPVNQVQPEAMTPAQFGAMYPGLSEQSGIPNPGMTASMSSAQTDPMPPVLPEPVASGWSEPVTPAQPDPMPSAQPEAMASGWPEPAAPVSPEPVAPAQPAPVQPEAAAMVQPEPAGQEEWQGYIPPYEDMQPDAFADSGFQPEPQEYMNSFDMPAPNGTFPYGGAATLGQDPFPDFNMGMGAIPPFPWSNNGQTGTDAPSRRITGGSRKASLYGLTFDRAMGKAILTTDLGTIFYDSASKEWTSDTDIPDVDLNDLYKKGSDFARKDLNQYNGFDVM